MTISIALTGGIGSGKSTVSKLFHELGAPIIDADVIAHQLVQKGQPALESIRDTIGTQFVTHEGLNRALLRQAIFDDPALKHKLEALLHPLIRKEILEQVTLKTYPYCIIVIPLLAEHFDEYIWLDHVLVVDVSEETQLERALLRDNHLPIETIKKMLTQQASREARLKIATRVIHNEGSLDALKMQVKALHEEWMLEIGHSNG